MDRPTTVLLELLRAGKHCENRKRLPWEHHIGCQMCQITLSKSTEKVFFYSINSTDIRDSSENNHATSPQKNITTFYFSTFSVLLEGAIWQIWQPMWCSKGSVLWFSQCFPYNWYWITTFSPTRPSGPSWSSSRDVRVSVCVCVCLSPSHAIFLK